MSHVPGVNVNGEAVTFAGVAVVSTTAAPDARVALKYCPIYPAAGATPDQLPQRAPGSKAFLAKVTVVELGMALVVL